MDNERLPCGCSNKKSLSKRIKELERRIDKLERLINKESNESSNVVITKRKIHDVIIEM